MLQITSMQRLTYPVDRCAFDKCDELTAVGVPCGCVVACFDQARRFNRQRQLGVGSSTMCPSCRTPVNMYIRAYWTGRDGSTIGGDTC